MDLNLNLKYYLLTPFLLIFILLLVVNVTHFEEVNVDPIEIEDVAFEDDNESIVYDWYESMALMSIDVIHLHQLIIYCQPSILLHRYLDVDTPPPEKMAYI